MPYGIYSSTLVAPTRRIFRASILEICHFDVYTSCREVAVAVEGGFVLLAGAVLNHSHLW